MTTPQPPAESAQGSRIEKIILKGRRARPAGWRTLFLLLLTAVLSWLAFTPVDAGPLAWICLVPFLLLTRTESPTHRLYLSTYCVGLLYWLITLQWMRLGDPSMYIALLAMSLYLACYGPVFLLLTRQALLKLKTPIWIAAPIFWVGLEYLRAHLFTGFAWYDLGHTQYRWIEIIQISDLVGVYGVSFLIVMANAALVHAIPQAWLKSFQLEWPEEHPAAEHPFKSQLVGVFATVAVLCTALGYGYVRRHQGEFPAGPRVALIQGNFTASLKSDTDEWGEIYQMHHALTGQTIPYQPHLIVWPEAMFRYPLMEYDKSLTDEELDDLHPMLRNADWKQTSGQQTLAELADKSHAALIMGVTVYEAAAKEFFLYNSAAFVEPGKGIQGRYDKIHRVIFGEYIPLQETIPLIQSLTPFRGDFGIDAGQQVHVFQHQDWRMLPLICFEDTVPHLVRSMVKSASKNESDPVDVIVNLSNDGWFHGSSELDQHLITALFRAIETRTPLVRAVNTGISAVIDGDGVIRTPDQFIDFDAVLNKESPRESMRDPRTGRFHRQLNCALIADVPLDPRTSLYVRLGDWFAILCLITTLAVTIQSMGCRQFFSRD